MSSVYFGLFAAALLLVLIPIWDWVSQQLLGQLFRRLEELELSTTLWRQLARMSGLSMLMALIVGLLTGTLILALAYCSIMMLVLPVLMAGSISKKKALVRGQIVEACVVISNSCRAGLALPEAFRVASTEVELPFRNFLRQVHTEYMHGRNLEDVLEDVRNRLDLDEFTLFSSAVLTCWDRGGNLPKTLERIAMSLQEHHRLEKKIESDTAEGKKVVSVLAIFPVIFLIAFVFLYPTGTLLYFTTLGGQILLVGIAILIFGAVVWSGKIIAIDA